MARTPRDEARVRGRCKSRNGKGVRGKGRRRIWRSTHGHGVHASTRNRQVDERLWRRVASFVNGSHGRSRATVPRTTYVMMCAECVQVGGERSEAHQ